MEGGQVAGRRVHFVGIGGSGMCGLARLVQQQGGLCTGSDQQDSDNVAALRAAGIDVSLEQSADSLPSDVEWLVISAAIKADHPEVVEAKRRGLSVVKYAAMLGHLMRGRCGVAIAGTHGKSTTTSMLCHVLIQAGLDPSFILGAQCEQIGGGSRCGALAQQPCDANTSTVAPTTNGDQRAGEQHAPSHDILVAEACEYDRSFHNFAPTHGVILNVEADHLDIYESLDEIVGAFADFARLLPAAEAGGTLLINHATPQRLAITAGLGCAVQTVGFSPEADWQVTVASPEAEPRDTHTLDDASTGPVTRLYHQGECVAHWPSPLPGEHMAYNAAVAAITAHRLGAAWPTIAEALAGFRGLDRRMQWVGTKGATNRSIPVIDDYGHHPTEIDTTLRALRGHWRPSRVICVFQPHQHSRTRFLMHQFATSFSQADIVIAADIYFVRDSEQERQAVTAGDLVDALRDQHVQAMHMHPLDAIVEQLEVLAQPGDLVVTMGAGNIWQVAYDFVQR
jgi:UDP-N-acetylmuramate--alanine ligase